MNDLNKLVEYVKNVPAGEITGENEKQVAQLLHKCWDELDGSGDTSMDIFKLHRNENLTFIPPATIEFEIERHGATTFGSVYAHVYKWTINLREGTASCDQHPKRRLVGERSRPLNVEPLAKEIAQQIIDIDKNAKKLEWKSDEKVKVLIGEVIPETNKQTTSARRKRFRNKLKELLDAHGWRTTLGYNIYEKSDK